MKLSNFVFPVFLLITLVTYFPTIGSGFVYDFLGWQRVYNEGSFSDIFNSFGYKGNHQLLHFFFYSTYSLFHIQGWSWYLIFGSLHALNGWLLYKWLQQVSFRWNLNISNFLITTCCILFLIHPYSVEPVVWKVCIHYLLSFNAVLGILLLSPSYVFDGNRKSLWLCLFIFALSLFLLEISFVTPAVISILFLIEVVAFRRSRPVILRSLSIVVSMWGLLVGYILLNKITLGSWVGHYGTEAHLSVDVIGMMSTEVKYFVKHLFDARFFSFKAKTLLFDTWLSSPELSFFLMVAFISLVLLYIIKVRKLSPAWHLVVFSVAASMLYVLPVSNLFFYHLHISMNDRYSYIPNAFLWIGVITLLSKSPKWFSHSLMGIVLLVNIYFQEKTIRYWHESTEVLTGLKNSYRWNDHSLVFVLNSPDNLNGIVMASIYGELTGIDEIIDFQTPRPNNAMMYDIFQYNMTSPNDGVKVEQTGPMLLKVTFNQWGNWWHRHGMGASSYENEYYKAETLDYPYLITFKQFPKGSAIIYQDGKEWKEFILKTED